MNKRAVQFLALSFTLSWGWWSFRLLPHWQQAFIAGLPVERSALSAWDIMPGMFAPLISAFFLRWLYRDVSLPLPLGLKRSWKQYLLSVMVPAMALLLAVPLYQVLGNGSFTWAGIEPIRLALSLFPIVLLASLTALGEEYGWRGYLLPLMLPLGVRKAWLITGIVWGAWHLPIVLSGLTYPGQPVLLAVLVFMTSTILLSFWFTELFVRSDQSVALAALSHGTLNALSEISSPVHFPGVNPMLSNPFGLVVAILVFVIAILSGRIFGTRGDSTRRDT